MTIPGGIDPEAVRIGGSAKQPSELHGHLEDFSPAVSIVCD